MPTVVHYGNGARAKFDCPGSNTKTVYVGGVLATPTATDFQSVTLSPAPAPGVPVQINYGESLEELTSVTYNVDGKVTSYVTNGVPHTVTYPNATTIVDVGGGVTTTVALDGAGRVIGAVVS